MTLFPTLQLNESRGWTKGTPYWLIKRKRPESMEANIFLPLRKKLRFETGTPWPSSPARQGEGASLPIYLTGPHSAGHAMDHGPGRLWGQKHHSLVTLSPHTGPQQPEGPGRRGGREEGLAPSWGRKPARLHSPGGVQEVL